MPNKQFEAHGINYTFSKSVDTPVRKIKTWEGTS